MNNYARYILYFDYCDSNPEYGDSNSESSNDKNANYFVLDASEFNPNYYNKWISDNKKVRTFIDVVNEAANIDKDYLYEHFKAAIEINYETTIYNFDRTHFTINKSLDTLFGDLNINWDILKLLSNNNTHSCAFRNI